MKKFLLGTVALVALGATVPALAADLGARAPTPRLRPMPRRSTTGPASTSAVTSAAHSPATTAWSPQQRRPFPRRRAGRIRLSVRSELGARYRSPVQLARPATITAGSSRAACWSPPTTACAWIGHRPARLHLGPGAALRQGRLCLEGRQQPWTSPPWRAGGLSPQSATIATATPSAAASNTCSPRAGPPRSNISTTISAAPPSRLVPRVIVGTSFRDDEHTVKAGLNYRFNWGGPVVAKY